MKRTGSTSSSRGARPLSLLSLLVFLAGCAAQPSAEPAPTDAPAEIRELLHESAAAWNRGDLDGFLADYADDASFVTGSGLAHGKEAVREIYDRGYWSGDGPEDELRFQDLDIRATGPRTAVAFGRFVLSDRGTGQTTSTGVFSLTLRRTAGGWEIVHDHSSGDG